jgi:molybdate transport system substrate-binding protein
MGGRGLVPRRVAAGALALASLGVAAHAAGAPPPISPWAAGGRSPSVVTPGSAPSVTDVSSTRELVLFEAASLKEAFAGLGAAFARENPGVNLVTNAAGSQELRAQIEQGAAADVFAAADHQQMDALMGEGLVMTASVFACNELVVVVRRALGATVTTLADLPTVERIVVGAPEVPVGAYTQQLLTRAATKLGADFRRRVESRIVSREVNVRQVLAKVLLGEADAAVVYRSDAASARGKVLVVAIPPELNIVAEYPMAILTAAPHAALGQRWLNLVRSPAGSAALRDAGFVTCPNMHPKTNPNTNPKTNPKTTSKRTPTTTPTATSAAPH